MATERARFFVDGVRAAITADITRRRDHGMVVTQALPFLRLDTKVVGEDGRCARISRVAIAMDGDVPRLLLELANEEADAIGAMLAVRDDATTPSFTPGVSMREARPDSTEPYEYQRRESAPQEIVVAERAIEPWWQRMLRRVSAFLAALTRPPHALPR